MNTAAMTDAEYDTWSEAEDKGRRDRRILSRVDETSNVIAGRECEADDSFYNTDAYTCLVCCTDSAFENAVDLGADPDSEAIYTPALQMAKSALDEWGYTVANDGTVTARR